VTGIYAGTVLHARRAPARAFRYRVHMLVVDVDAVPAWLPFRRRDYLGDPRRPLRAEVLDRVEAALGERPAGAVLLLTQIRPLGRAFNPVSFYYCLAADGAPRAVVAEITNTPWNERHAYVLAAGAGGAAADFDKSFHVSPFFPMAQRYRWRMDPPGERIGVDMINEESGREVFRARLSLARRAPLTRTAYARAALAQPIAAWRTLAAIYWQALRLYLAGAPFHPHPARR
jgi:DUF1365 family protein